MNSVLFYLLQVSLIIDQACNVLLGGYADETLSSRAYRVWRNDKLFGKIFKPLIDHIFFWQKDHCRNAYLQEIYKKQLPPEFTKWKDE